MTQRWHFFGEAMTKAVEQSDFIAQHLAKGLEGKILRQAPCKVLALKKIAKAKHSLILPRVKALC